MRYQDLFLSRRIMENEQKPFIVAVSIFLCLFVFFILLLFIINSCTFSMSQVHSKAGGADTVSEQQTNTPTTSTDATVPVSLMPSIPKILNPSQPSK